ncbi:hypothetical protein EVG20_g2557 [Dentipellis fragilis]|uniref:Uncharacterized protein n=1 Tax=Dentipellis fragilis TaxID=205917 RepID=A0A4Y9Z8U5_9AGAM|nr:hypothetical protein EVG20_g2557 [Dentipellis fragilis]
MSGCVRTRGRNLGWSELLDQEKKMEAGGGSGLGYNRPASSAGGHAALRLRDSENTWMDDFQCAARSASSHPKLTFTNL